MSDYTPREIVSELDRFIVGQDKAKRAVAIALRNRWRRRRVEDPLSREITPKNILMVGPTGVGKTEVSRRLAKLAGAPFIKVEATKFTEVGYVGRDVESIIRDLVEIAVAMEREERREDVRVSAETMAEERVIDALVGEGGKEASRERFRAMLRAGELDDREIEIALRDQGGSKPAFDMPGMPGAQISMVDLCEMFGKAFAGAAQKRRIKIKDAYAPLLAEESDKLLDEDTLSRDAVSRVENDGIVFLDEIDKIARGAAQASGADVSREGVQRDLLPLIEGSTIATKYGAVKTDHILFIASGAFHVAKPSDLLPELQGRLPIRVELEALTRDDLRRILVEPEASLVRQYTALLATEGVEIEFTDDAADALADAAAMVNANVENIGARRLATIMETMLDEISFAAPDRRGARLVIDAGYVKERLDDIASNVDLSKYIL